MKYLTKLGVDESLSKYTYYLINDFRLLALSEFLSGLHGSICSRMDQVKLADDSLMQVLKNSQNAKSHDSENS